jgi:hypothetical protein
MNSSEPPENTSSAKLLVEVALAIWLALVFILGANGSFVRAPGEAPIPILLGVIVPLVVFGVAYWGWRAFRALVFAADLRLLTAIQAWRAGGLAFLALMVHGILPGSFAWPAGLGDIAIGVTAPWVMLALIRRPAFVASRLFVVWNLLGILDLVVAISTGALSAGVLGETTGTVTTTPMSYLPLVLIPAYLVPLFVMLHITALVQARRFSASARSAEQLRREQPVEVG